MNSIAQYLRYLLGNSPKEDKKDYSVLQLLIEPRYTEAARNLENWLISKGIDVNNENWLLLLKRVVPDRCLEADVLGYDLACTLKSILPFLLKCNDNINYTNEEGQTILHHYLANHERYCKDYVIRSKEYSQTVKYLLDKGASVDAVDGNGKTPLHVAAENNLLDLVQPMLNFFNNVAARDNQGDTVLHCVVIASIDRNGFLKQKYSDIIRMLLSKGADPNVQNHDGLTPVHLAAIRYNVQLLQIFKETGGDFSVRTDNGENVVLLAYKHKMLSPSDYRVPIAINFLVNQGCDVNAQDGDGISALHYATRGPEVESNKEVESLLKLGADVNCRTKTGHTPLHWAVLELEFYVHKKREGVIALLEAGAHWDAADFGGETPLHMAIDAQDDDLFNCFLHYGADINDRRTIDLIIHSDKKLYGMACFHAIMLKAAGFPVAKIYELHGSEFLSDSRRHREDCANEVNKLRKCMISDGMSYYEFLHMNSRRQLAFVERLPPDLEQMFPIYYKLIMSACRNAVRRNQLLEPAKSAWNEITDVNWPDICAELIFYFLTNGSLQDLIDTATMCCDDAASA